MGHTVNGEGAYTRLQQRLDRNVTGAPATPAFMQILKLLYSEQEAEIARQLPAFPTSLHTLSRKLGVPEAELDEKLSQMAQRGVVLDLSRGDRRYYALPPVVIGFFEYTFMRVRDDVPQAELARLFEEYMYEDGGLAPAVFTGHAQLGRALIREEALADGDFVEVLDWERATRLVEGAATVGLSLCSCRHKASHIGKACDRPMDTCLTLDYGAETLIRMGAARRITAADGLAVLAESKAAGLAQVADNVQRKPGYICNCCGCCCGMMGAIRTSQIRGAIVTSNWIMEVDEARCTGCGKCVKACPVGAIALVIQEVDGKRRGKAVRDEGLCLGCGVCKGTCKVAGIDFRPREQRVYTPETMFDLVLTMAIERGKLAEVVFAEPEGLSAQALKRVVKAVERSSPYKAAMAVAPLRSAFLDGIVSAAKKRAGGLID